MYVTIAGKSVWLNYHHLYYFQVIAAEGSIARAAQKLRLGQPTLSAQLKQFEDTLDLKLFERSHKRLILTENGRVALEYAREIFRMGGEMVEVLHDKLLPNRTHVQIGALDSVPKHLILTLAKAAYAIGNCSVSILEGKADELLRELSAHRIDLILTNFIPTEAQANGIYCRAIAKVPVVICGAPSFRHLKKGFPTSIDQKPFVLPTHHSKLRHDIDHYSKLNGLQMDIIAETQDTSLQKLLGADGIGLMAAPLPAVADLLKKGELVELGRPKGVYEELFLVAASRRIENPVSSRLMKTFGVE